MDASASGDCGCRINPLLVLTVSFLIHMGSSMSAALTFGCLGCLIILEKLLHLVSCLFFVTSSTLLLMNDSKRAINLYWWAWGYNIGLLDKVLRYLSRLIHLLGRMMSIGWGGTLCRGKLMMFLRAWSGYIWRWYLSLIVILYLVLCLRLLMLLLRSLVLLLHKSINIEMINICIYL